ncbi:ATP-binding protein [Streptomyces sp. PSKA54]|uniref:ATP-binding protein n=1 Tax=Streptomyces himalayensis subsp. aureolus TaxID=2758039 RepID=A0A7W2CYU4_9ACTN|nr:ATP-binding protein [Streptomyces himalayensis]MBA4861623.1 ATP-binding protein [Streptomyces himalayensis subsp. aureolus]
MPPDAKTRTPVTVRVFSQQLSSTPRGARLARRLVAERLDAWGWPYASELNEAVTLITAELAANAVRHGRLPGRDFRIRLTVTEGTVRVEVTDARGERLPAICPAGGEVEGGRGLVLVDALADRWGVDPRTTGVGKTVWAEIRDHEPVSAQCAAPRE